MKRRDMLQNLLTPAAPNQAPVETGRARVASGAVRAMGLQLDRLADEARQASELRESLSSEGAVIELEPDLVEASFMTDRFLPTADAGYRTLVDSIRDHGQQVPALVRPHPEISGRYQIAYGHRRREATRELGIRLKAIVRPLSDEQLVVAQGKENAERHDLSFIERVLFASGLHKRGYGRSVLMAALGVQASEMSRLLSVAEMTPSDIILSVGPAPKVGRPRWLELGRLLATKGGLVTAKAFVKTPEFQRLATDRRFYALFDRVRGTVAEEDATITFPLRTGAVAVRANRFSNTLRLTVDERVVPGLSDRLLDLLPALICDLEKSKQ